MLQCLLRSCLLPVMDMIRLTLTAIVIIGLTGVFGDQEHIHFRIHVPSIKHDVHHTKVVYKHVNKHKHKISHHSHHTSEKDDDHGWEESDDEHDHHEDEYEDEDWDRK